MVLTTLFRTKEKEALWIQPSSPPHYGKLGKYLKIKHICQGVTEKSRRGNKVYFCLLRRFASSATLSLDQIRCIEIQVPKATCSKWEHTSLKVAADGI